MKICKVCKKHISSARNISVCSKICRNILNKSITPFKNGHRQFNSGKTHFKKGFTPWNKGKKTPKEYTKKAVEVRMANGSYNISEEHRKKLISNASRGETHHNWKGGLTKLAEKVRKCFEYRQWRSDIFTRDNYACQICGIRGTYLEADHFPKMFAQILREYKIQSMEDALKCSELWSFNNGRTLCKECHKKTDTYLKNI